MDSRLWPRIAPCLTLIVIASTTPSPMVRAQGADHSGGHQGDSIRCTSGKPEAAIPACTSIIEDKRESDDNRAIALRNRAFRYQQVGDFDKAIADYTTALKRCEQRTVEAKTRLNRGLMYARKGEESDALADYNEAIQLDPKLASAYINRASLYSKQGNDDQAIEDLNQALSINPKEGEIYKSCGWPDLHASQALRGDPQMAHLVVFSYFAVLAIVHVPWSEFFLGLAWPRLTLDKNLWLMVAAILGTTISPYLFFWQAAQEVEDTKTEPIRQPLLRRPGQGANALARIRLDTAVGMGISNLVALAMMATAAATLHGSKNEDIQSAAQAAEALRPLAGSFAFGLFAWGS